MSQTVLLVDDEPNLLRALCRTLRKQPYEIFTAQSAKEAMQILKARPIDLIVTDEYMNGMRGTELLAWVANHCPDVVRIVFTGQPSIPAMLSAINDGHVFRFFTKPCNEVELALAIREGLERKRAQTSYELEVGTS